MRRLGAAAALAIPLLCAGASHAAEDEPGRPTIYKWVDENGIAHYTTDRKRVPKNLRNKIRDVDEMRAEQTGPPPPPPAPTPPATGVAGGAPAPAPPSAGTPTGTASAADTFTGTTPPAGATSGAAGSAASGTAAGTTTATAAAGAAGAASGSTSPAPYPPLTGPPTRSDIYSVQDAGSEPEGGSVREGDFRDGEEPLVDGEPPPLDPAMLARRDELDQQIAGLEVELAKEERRLKELISVSEEVDGQPAPLYGVPELEELARRFPELQAQIAALRAERRALEQTN
jgi:chaperonin cofactor prefoldin